MSDPYSRSSRALIVVSCAILAPLVGCASLIVRDYDPAGVQVAKVLVRIPLGIATAGLSEGEISLARMRERGGSGCDASCLAILLGASMSRPAPTYPVYVPTVQQPRNCTSYPVGNNVVTNCW